MRILVVGQPSSGLFILANFLKKIYLLNDLNAIKSKLPNSESNLIAFIEAGDFADDSILTQHYCYTDPLIEACQNIHCHIFCVVKNPYEIFEAIYLRANSKAGISSSPTSMLLNGIELESKESINFIKTNFAKQLGIFESWYRSNKAHIVKFEELIQHPEKYLEALCEKIRPVNKSAISDAARAVFSGQFAPGAQDTLSESRLPLNVINALNTVMPRAYKEIGYQIEDVSPEGVIARRLISFADFLHQYSKKQRVFIVGHGKSGTTWLHMVFFHHPNTAAVAERRLIEHPDKNDALLDTLLDDQHFGSWFSSSSFGIAFPEQKDIRYELSRLLSDYLVYRAIAARKTVKGFGRRTPITHFSEKIALNSKADAQATILNLKKLYPDAKIIHIVRDPRDVAISAMYHSYRNFKKQGDNNWITKFLDSLVDEKPEGFVQKTIAVKYFRDHAKSWNEIVSAFHDIGLREYGDNYYYLRYEDLLKHPRKIVTEVFQFTGLECTDKILQTVVDNTSFESLSQGRSSGQQDESSFFRKGISGDWRNYMSEQQGVQLFVPAKRLMDTFGYN